MSENVLRHLISLSGTLICALAFIAGYVSGVNSWWWAVFLVGFVYMLIFRLLQHH